MSRVDRLEPGRTYRTRGGAITIVRCHGWHDKPDEPGWYTIEQGAEGQPGRSFSLVEDGDDESAPGKCGWAWWVDGTEDSTSYVHEDLNIERY